MVPLSSSLATAEGFIEVNVGSTVLVALVLIVIAVAAIVSVVIAARR